MNDADTLAAFLDDRPADLAGLDALDLAQIAQLGIASFAAAQYARAQRVFEVMSKLAPALYLPHQYLGMIAEEEGALERAAVSYAEACARIDPDAEALTPVFNDTLFLLAGVLLRLKRPGEAAGILEVLLERRAQLSEPMLRQSLAMVKMVEVAS
jgi:hypothetical protein